MIRSLTHLTVLALFCGSLSAATIVYTASLSGANEGPPNLSTGTGLATVTYDSIAHTLKIGIDFSGLTGLTTTANIHCCIDPPGNIGVAVLLAASGFPLGVTSGSYLQTVSSTFDLFATFVQFQGGGTQAGAEAVLVAAMNAGRAYVNINTTQYGGGEIRGFLQPSSETGPTGVPEPATWALIAAPLAALALARRSHSRN